MSIHIGTNEIKDLYIGTSQVKEVYIGATKIWPSIITKTYSITPVVNSTVYQNIALSGKQLEQITFEFYASYYSQGLLNIGISNNGNTNSWYVLRINHSNSYWFIYRKLNNGSDAWCRTSDSEITIGNIIFTINRNGQCSVYYKGNGGYTTKTYTATGDELNTIQTIMNLSDINVCVNQNNRPFIDPNIVKVTAIYS